MFPYKGGNAQCDDLAIPILINSRIYVSPPKRCGQSNCPTKTLPLNSNNCVKFLHIKSS